jgi:5'-3' exonuclease
MVPSKTAPTMLPIFGTKSAPQSTTWANTLLLDWSNLVHRAVAVSTADTYVGTLAKMLLHHRRRFATWRFVFALEGEHGTEARKALLPAYKANRGTHTDEDLAIVSMSKKLLGFTTCALVWSTYGEADDAIASYVKHRSKGGRTVIVSEDKDLWQLITNRVTVWGKQGSEITSERCLSYLGVRPEQVPMLKALLGDPSDNIQRGVPRLKTAALTYLAKQGTTPDELARVLLGTTELKDKDVTKIRDHWAAVEQNYRVVKLHGDLALLEETHRADVAGLEKFLHEQGVTWYTREELTLIAAGS